jgi:hypothetical protein
MAPASGASRIENGSPPPTPDVTADVSKLGFSIDIGWDRLGWLELLAKPASLIQG